MPKQGLSYPILLVDDEPEILQLTKTMLESEGIGNVLTMRDSREVIPLLGRERVSVIVLDLMMPYMSGLDLLQAIVDECPCIPIIVVTALDEVGTAVECLKRGAFDYLLKPVEPNALLAAVRKAIRLSSLQNENSSLKNYLLTDRLEHAEAFKEIITCSKKMRAVFQYTEVIAQSSQPILITGETGTGKELMASAVHKLSGLTGEYVAINLAGLDDVMFSDTLFGHRKGAFTGAEQPREGLVAKACGGTLFLDEIGDLNPLSQVKLLRLLQEGEYYPLGSDVPKSSGARIVVATNHDLDRAMAEGTFRKDLYYRLSGYQLHLPPLRERVEDIPLLLNHFIAQAAEAFAKPRPVPSPEVADSLASLLFAGNIRELRAMVFDAVARHSEGVLSCRHFPAIPRPASTFNSAVLVATDERPDPLSMVFGKFPTLDEVEQYMIGRAMSLSQGKTSGAAALLGISRQGLHKRIRPLKMKEDAVTCED